VLRQKGHDGKGGHVDPDQGVGLHSDEFGQGPVHPQNISRLIVGHDEVADGVENFHPVAVGLIHSGE
jgi:hypothetical protein